MGKAGSAKAADLLALVAEARHFPSRQSRRKMQRRERSGASMLGCWKGS